MGLASGFKEYGAGSSMALGLARAYQRSIRGVSLPDAALGQASRFDPSIRITVCFYGIPSRLFALPYTHN